MLCLGLDLQPFERDGAAAFVAVAIAAVGQGFEGALDAGQVGRVDVDHSSGHVIKCENRASGSPLNRPFDRQGNTGEAAGGDPLVIIKAGVGTGEKFRHGRKIPD